MIDGQHRSLVGSTAASAPMLHNEGATLLGMRHSITDTADEFAAANRRAVDYFRSGDYRRATVLFEKTLHGCREELGAEHPASLTVAGNLGVALVKAERFDEGIDVIQRNLADRTRVLGENDRQTLSALDALAVSYRCASRLPEAIQLAQSAAVRRAEQFGQADPDTLTSRLGLALSLAEADDGARAAAEITAAVEDAQDMLGPEHPHTVALLNHAITLAR
jgi:tetratricopeptide (TPR) repeat protein